MFWGIKVKLLEIFQPSSQEDLHTNILPLSFSFQLLRDENLNVLPTFPTPQKNEFLSRRN